MAKIRAKSRKKGITEDEMRRFYGINQVLGSWAEEGKTPKAELWRDHREAIIRFCINRAQTQGKPGERPREFFRELEAKRARRKNEGDFQYLKRLGLLEPWELEERGK